MALRGEDQPEEGDVAVGQGARQAKLAEPSSLVFFSAKQGKEREEEEVSELQKKHFTVKQASLKNQWRNVSLLTSRGQPFRDPRAAPPTGRTAVRMASSSVSQDDIDNDFELNSR